MTRRVFPALCAVMLVAGLAARAEAATITYTSSSAYIAAVGAGLITETYESLPLNSVIAAGSTVDGITYNSFPAGKQGRIDNTFNRIGNQSLAATPDAGFFFPGESFTVTFPFAVRATGIFFNVAVSPANSLFLLTNTGASAGNGSAYDFGTVYFIGLISDTAFTSVTFGGNLNTASGFNVDNLSYAQNVVPEPTSMLLLGSGLIGVLVRRRLGFSRT